MELLIAAFLILLVLRAVLGAVGRGAVLLLGLVALVQVLGWVDPRLFAALGGPLLLLAIVTVGLRLLTRGLVR